ncbi:MAG: DNA-3-methyladenine glycosylase 2 family protein [Verrucomicrobia bacterium]|nr:DNA-3-methyladenine glycosylase 2 family protein [Verrucomicrobiota bacterium]
MSFQPVQVETGLTYLRNADSILATVIDRVGPFTLRVHRNRFGSLVRSIISQQISGSAARSIGLRLERLLAPERITPETLSRLNPRQLRQAGVSPQKSGYLLDLANKVLNGEVTLKGLSRRTDEEIVRDLVQVKGIGVWTAQMFLIFSLARMDVFPHEDLGIRVALRNLYRLKDLPDKTVSYRIANRWRPYATLASWYCWRSLD